MRFPNIDPVIIAIGPLAVTWYSLSYVAGILIGWFYALRIVSQFDTPITKQNIDDFITWVIIGIIVGGRLGYVLFYDPAKYFANPIEIIKTYKGGMSFHGGVLGFVASSYLYCYKSRIRYIQFTDICAIVAPIGIFFGRIANFINGELYGNVTDVPWAVIFPNSDGLPRHPSQLYEAALEGVALFFITTIATYRFNALDKPGVTSGIFLTFYAIFRLFIEIFRAPDYKIGYIAEYFTMGQILSIPMIIFGTYLIIRKKHAD